MTDKFVAPPFLRKPHLDSIEWAMSCISSIDRRVAWLDERGLRTHANVLAKREKYMQKLAENPKMLALFLADAAADL